MKQKQSLLRYLQVPAMAGLALVGTLNSTEAQAKSEPFSHMVIFGDSLCDTGNYYRLCGGNVPPSCVNGRFSTGPLWVEYLADNLGMEYQAADNFAVAGATTGTLNSNGAYAGLLDEVEGYLAAGPVSEPERALYVVEGGANDFFIALALNQDPATTVANGINNTLRAVQRLWASGARHILVMNLPDLGVTPMASSLGLSAQLHQLGAMYNRYMAAALDELARAGIPTLRLDAFSVLDRMAASPAQYGFSNVMNPYLYVLSGQPNEYLFWDPVHPTTGAHRVLADEAVQQMLQAFSPNQGKGAPDARVNGLNGLVNAATKR